MYGKNVTGKLLRVSAILAFLFSVAGIGIVGASGSSATYGANVTGTATVVLPTCSVSLAGSPTFGTIQLGGTAQSNQVTITNIGNTPANVVSISGGDWVAGGNLLGNSVGWTTYSTSTSSSQTALTNTSTPINGANTLIGGQTDLYFDFNPPLNAPIGTYTEQITVLASC